MAPFTHRIYEQRALRRAGNSGGTAEALVDGETGTLANCASVLQLTQAVIGELVLSAGLTKKGQAGRNWVTSQHGWNSGAVLHLAASLFLRPASNDPQSETEVGADANLVRRTEIAMTELQNHVLLPGDSP